MLESSPELVLELVEARHDTEIPGLLDLGEAWHALDYLVSRGGEDPVLGDAIVGRKGRAFGKAIGYAKPRILTVDRVNEIAAALAKLPEDHVRARYDELSTQDIHGFGAGTKSEDALDLASIDEDGETEPSEERETQIEELERHLVALRELYRAAAEKKHSMLTVVV